MNRYTLSGLFGALSGHQHAVAAPSGLAHTSPIHQPPTIQARNSDDRPPPIVALDPHVPSNTIPQSGAPSPTLSVAGELFGIAGRPVAFG